MNKQFKKLLLPCSAILVILICSCAPIPATAPEDSALSAYAVEDKGTLLTRYAPGFVIENDQQLYNRIGTPVAQIDADGEEIISVSPEKATVYTQMDSFTTDKGSFTNLLYRIHFEEIPGGLTPFYLGQGRNIGLLVIVTLDSRNRPILYTSLHTCGCYLAFVPTTYMPEDFFPATWDRGRQSIYGEDLPGLLDYSLSPPGTAKTLILLRDATHRVKDIWLSSPVSLNGYQLIPIEMQPFAALEQLPLNGQETTSFYETSGPRTGYVKGSHKIMERLLMSWWALDWRIGEDKKLGKDNNDGILFYTSLKPWNRQNSDLRDFARFLKFWGWNFSSQ